MKILNFGSLNVDYIYKVDRFVAQGETISSKDLIVEAGGKGFNQTLALSKVCSELYHAGKIGNAEKSFFIPLLEKNMVKTQFIKSTDNKTGHAIIQLCPDGQNGILLYGGANQSIDVPFIDEVLSYFECGDYLVVQNEISCLSSLIEKSIAIGMKVFLNPSPFTEDLMSLPIENIDTIILNEIEGKQFTGETLPDTIVDVMIKKYSNTNILLTLGSQGSLYVSSKEKHFEPAILTPVIDTTAAGDTFTGYFIGSLSRGYSVSESMKIATKAASIAVGILGTACSIPSWDDVAALK